MAAIPLKPKQGLSGPPVHGHTAFYAVGLVRRRDPIIEILATGGKVGARTASERRPRLSWERYSLHLYDFLIYSY
jgi:hypothetical protein